MTRAHNILLLLEDRSEDVKDVIKHLDIIAKQIQKDLLPRLGVESSGGRVKLIYSQKRKEKFTITFPLKTKFKKSLSSIPRFYVSRLVWNSDLESETNRHITYSDPTLEGPNLDLIFSLGFLKTVPQKSVSRYLYHVASNKSIASIMKKGLLPDYRKTTGRHTGRLYVAQQIGVKGDNYRGQKDVTHQIRIDKKKLPKDTIYFGHTRRGEIMVEKPIPPSAMTVIELLDV